MPMICHDKVALLESMIRNRPNHKIQNAKSLKEALRAGLSDFEEMLKPLSAHDRKAALSLFLERIRETGLEFHLAVLKLIAKNELHQSPTDEKVRELLDRSEKEMMRIARLYRLL
jgi:hypothetical protein